LRGVRVTALEHATHEQILLDEGQPVIVSAVRLPAAVAASRGASADLPFVARQDGTSLSGTVTLLGPDGSNPGALVLIGGEAPPGAAPWAVGSRDGSHALPPGPRRALILRPSLGGEPADVELQLGEALLDQAFWARAVPADPGGWRLLKTRRVQLGQGRLGAWTRRLGSGPLWPSVERVAEGDPSRLESLPPALAPGELLELWLEPPRRATEGRTWTVMITIQSEGSDGAPGPLAPFASAPHAPAPLFTDVTRAAGVTMVHMEGPDEQLDIRPTMGPGAAWGDVDGDGWVDLYLVQGSGREGSSPPTNRLLHNLGDGTFEDVTRDSGAGDDGAGMGALFFDADQDGDLDLYVANRGPDRLYENDGSGHFTDVSEAAGLTLDLWSAGVSASDVDRDGDLDLYVTSYLDFDLEKMPPADGLERYGREDPLAMLPFAFPGQRNVFLRNEGGLRFTDATGELGLADVQGRGMQAVFWDFDRDGDDDLYVANDVSFNVLYRNEGDGTFEDISFITGLDDPRGGMGLA
ncbi:MAG: VCBS repeat-containing protein, partial [Planctomycetota bacterium]